MKGETAAVAAALLWGVNYSTVKLVLKSMPEPQFLLLRFAISTCVMAVWLKLRGETLIVERRHLAPVLALGIAGVGIFNILWTYGIHRTTASNAAVLIATSPIIAGLYSALLRIERPAPRRFVGTALAFAGVYAIVAASPAGRFDPKSGSLSGNLLVFTSAFLSAFYSVTAKPLLGCYSPLKLTALAMAGGLPVLVPFGLVHGDFSALAGLAPATWLQFAYVVACGTVISFTLWYQGIRDSGPLKTTLFHFLVPTVSMVVAPLILGEIVSRAQIAGAVLVFTGVVIARGTTPRQSPQTRASA